MPQYVNWHMSARDKATIENIIREEIRNAGLTESEIREMMSEVALRKRVRAAAQEIRARREGKVTAQIQITDLPKPARVA